MAQLDRITGLQVCSAIYRVRAENSVGWGNFCDPFVVDLVEKLRKPTVKLRGDKYAMRRTKQLLLPHGVVLSRKTTCSGDSDIGVDNVSFTSNKNPPLKVLSYDEVKDILHSNMLCAPAPQSHDLNDESDHDSFNEMGETKKRKSGNTDDDLCGDSMSSMSDAERLKSVKIDPSSSLAGDSLEDVNQDLELWLSRLANACPLEEKEDMWQSRKRLAAKESLHSSQLLQLDNRLDVEEGTTSKNNSASPHKVRKKGEPLIMDNIYSLSEKHLRNVTQCGEKSELDNVIQRLAMVRKKAPSKSNAPNEKMKLTISPLPAIAFNKTA